MEILFHALIDALRWQNLLALVAGGVYGIVIGVLPGIGSAVGMALALPLTLRWHPATALIFLCASYKLEAFPLAIHCKAHGPGATQRHRTFS